MQVITKLVHQTITEEGNENMQKLFTMEEFRQALFPMHQDKAPIGRS